MIYIQRKRYEKIVSVLKQRQPSLALLAENLQDPHNLSAISRTCDAIGLMHLWTIAYNRDSMHIQNGISQGAAKWLNMRSFDQLESIEKEARSHGMQTVCTTFSNRAIDFRAIDYTQPTLIMMGQEGWGASEKAQAMADHHVIIPMMGMAQSLNVSVAAALILYEAQRQRVAAKMYDTCQLNEKSYNRLLFQYCAPKVARHYQKNGIPFPDKVEDILEFVEEKELDGPHHDGRDAQRLSGRKRHQFDPKS